MFFVTAFENIPESDRNLLIGDSHTFGYFEIYENAKECLHRNIFDIHETCYNYAVVEEIGTGIHPEVSWRQFFKYSKDKDGFFEIEEPKFLKRLCNFALG